MKLTLIPLSFTLLLSSEIMAQVCYDGVSETSPSARFTVNGDGTVSDLQTGLMWQQCSFGQTFNDELNQCEGATQQLNWGEALRGASNSELAAYTDWQVPNIKELASILEHQCVQPSINETVFFDTQLNNYWSSTSGVSRADLAWVYQFDKGLNSLHAKTSDIFLRLVRYEK